MNAQRSFIPEEAAHGRSANAAGPPRILLADDSRGFRALLALALQRERYEVTVVADGLELLAAISHEGARHFDLILADVRMPGAGGFEVLTHLREAGSHIPLVLMTSFGGRDFAEQARARGADASLEKPFDLVDLKATVARLLERAQRQ
jgi:CheY-like chemotaxis protein